MLFGSLTQESIFKLLNFQHIGKNENDHEKKKIYKFSHIHVT